MMVGMWLYHISTLHHYYIFPPSGNMTGGNILVGHDCVGLWETCNTPQRICLKETFSKFPKWPQVCIAPSPQNYSVSTFLTILCQHFWRFCVNISDDSVYKIIWWKVIIFPNKNYAISSYDAVTKTKYIRRTKSCKVVLLLLRKVLWSSDCFSGRNGLSQQRQTHSGGKEFNCSQCNKSFSQAGNLKTHSLIHTGEKPHKCTQCNYSSNVVTNLRRHILEHTGEKPHKCNQCDYASIHSGHLKKHKRTHSGEKPHRCTMCEFSSITTNALKVHMMSQHTGAKQFKCNQCNYSCASSGNLQNHMKTHTGEKPFKCNQCSKAYKHKQKLTKHSQLHMTSD